MAGWISRVITVTYGPRYLRLPSHVAARSIISRGPLISDAMLKYPGGLTPPDGFSSGPCGTAAKGPGGGSVWRHLVADLGDYIERWGSNPLGVAHRQGAGAGATFKQGKRGRGSQDYLFQRKGAGP